jgi:hypothetical protein
MRKRRLGADQPDQTEVLRCRESTSGQEHFTMSELQPILVPISQASAIIGKCRRGIYQLIATDQLKAVKSGRSTLVVYESLKQYAANLPVAKFRTQHGATPKSERSWSRDR